jgi:hypothetical protein
MELTVEMGGAMGGMAARYVGVKGVAKKVVVKVVVEVVVEVVVAVVWM